MPGLGRAVDWQEHLRCRNARGARELFQFRICTVTGTRSKRRVMPGIDRVVDGAGSCSRDRCHTVSISGRLFASPDGNRTDCCHSAGVVHWLDRSIPTVGREAPVFFLSMAGKLSGNLTRGSRSEISIQAIDKQASKAAFCKLRGWRKCRRSFQSCHRCTAALM